MTIWRVAESGPVGFAGRLSLALAPALMFGAYARWPAAAFLAYLVLVPWIVLYTDDRNPRVPLAYYFVGAYASWILLYPQAFRFAGSAAFLMGLVLFAPMLVFAPLLRTIHHRLRLPRVLVVPLLWVASEWFRATFTLAHFDLYALGYSQARFPLLIQVADVTGVYGLSFIIAAVNALAADVWFALRDRREATASGSARRLAVAAGVVALTFLLAGAYGLYRLRSIRPIPGPSLAIVQPNVSHERRNGVGVHLTQVALTAAEVGRSRADLIVWPEFAIQDDLRRDGAYLEDLAWLAGQKDALIFVGAMDEPVEHPGRTRNAAFLVDAAGRIVEQYNKQMLFPWTEYLPLDGVLARLAPSLHRAYRMLCRKGWGFVSMGLPGEGTVLFELPFEGSLLPFAALICVENVYPPLPARAGRLGARFFVNLTSEGAVAGPVQEQLLRICILRAVENRVTYVRAGNTGISAFIDARGEVQSLLRGKRGATINDAGVLVDRVALSPPGPTLYVRSFDAFANGCVGATLLLLVVGVWRPRAVVAGTGVR